MPYKYYYIPGPFSIVQRACAHRVQESTYAVYIYIVSYMVNIFIYIYSHLMAYQKMSDARWRAITEPCTMHRSIYSILYLFRIYDMRLINFIATRWLWHCLAVCWHHVTLPSVLNARCSCFFFLPFDAPSHHQHRMHGHISESFILVSRIRVAIWHNININIIHCQLMIVSSCS